MCNSIKMDGRVLLSGKILVGNDCAARCEAGALDHLLMNYFGHRDTARSEVIFG